MLLLHSLYCSFVEHLVVDVLLLFLGLKTTSLFRWLCYEKNRPHQFCLSFCKQIKQFRILFVARLVQILSHHFSWHWIPWLSGKVYLCKKKSRFRETLNLLTDADSSTDTTVGWTKNTQKPKKIEKRKKSSKTRKLKNV